MRTTPQKVLVVEDDPDIRLILSRRLAEAGFTPLLAADGEEALQRLAEHPGCQRVITDFMMPGLSGDRWIRLLEERSDGDWTVIVVSAEDIDPGRFVISPKPIDIPNLISHLQRVA